jgi:hypothetical protein
VELERHLAVGLLDLALGGAALQVEDLIGVEDLDLGGLDAHVPQHPEPDQPHDDGDDAPCGGVGGG